MPAFTGVCGGSWVAQERRAGAIIPARSRPCSRQLHHPNRSGSVTSSSTWTPASFDEAATASRFPNSRCALLEVLLEHPGRRRLARAAARAAMGCRHVRGLRARPERRSEAVARCARGLGRRSPQFIETVPKRGYRFIARLIPTPAASVADEPQRWPGLWRVAAFLIALVALGLVADRWMRPRQPAPVLAAPVAPNETRLTFGSGLQTEPAWSPDGRMVAYVSAVSGKRDVWVQPIAGGEAIQLTKSAVMRVGAFLGWRRHDCVSCRGARKRDLRGAGPRRTAAAPDDIRCLRRSGRPTADSSCSDRLEKVSASATVSSSSGGTAGLRFASSSGRPGASRM